MDRLLIVTFTEAAAAEMKERIGAAIEKKLAERPGDTHLEQQGNADPQRCDHDDPQLLSLCHKRTLSCDRD